MEQRRALVVSDTEIVHQRDREQVSQGSERDRLRRGVADRPLHRPPGALGPAQGFLGEAGLADTGEALKDDPTTRPVAVEMADLFELGGPPRQGPWRDHDLPGAR